MNEFLPTLQATGAISGWAAAVTALGVLLGFWTKFKTIQGRTDDSLRHDLLEEIGRLRTENIEERKDCDKKISAQGERHQEQLKAMGERHDRQINSLECEIMGLRAEIKQMSLSFARTANIPISSTLLKAYPLPPEIESEARKLDDDDAA